MDGRPAGRTVGRTDGRTACLPATDLSHASLDVKSSEAFIFVVRRRRRRPCGVRRRRLHTPTFEGFVKHILIFDDLYAHKLQKSFFFTTKQKVDLQPELGVGVCCKLIVGERLYGYVCRLSIRHCGFHNRGAGAEGTRPIVVEAAEGRLHNGGWKGCKHSHTTYPQRFTYNIHPHQVSVLGRFAVCSEKTTFVF